MCSALGWKFLATTAGETHAFRSTWASGVTVSSNGKDTNRFSLSIPPTTGWGFESFTAYRGWVEGHPLCKRKHGWSCHRVYGWNGEVSGRLFIFLLLNDAVDNGLSPLRDVPIDQAAGAWQGGLWFHGGVFVRFLPVIIHELVPLQLLLTAMMVDGVRVPRECGEQQEQYQQKSNDTASYNGSRLVYGKIWPVLDGPDSASSSA